MIGLHASSIVDEAIRRTSSQFVFFNEKILSLQKASKRKITYFHPLWSFLCKKLLPLLFFVRLFVVLLVGFGWFTFFYPQNLLVKKENKLIKKCPDSLIYYTTPFIFLSYYFLKLSKSQCLCFSQPFHRSSLSSSRKWCFCFYPSSSLFVNFIFLSLTLPLICFFVTS